MLAAVAAAAAMPAGSLRFASFGCWGGEKNARARQRKVAETLKQLCRSDSLEFSLVAGDNFYRKGVLTVDDPRWQETYEDVFPAGHPFYVALGNHDYRGDVWAQVNYTTSARNRGSAWHLPHPYYSATFALQPGQEPADGLQVFVVDTVLMERCAVNPYGGQLWRNRCWDKGRQRSWLAAQLESSTAQWRIVMGHYPMHANGPHRNQLWLREWLEPLFEKHSVAMYINADNHYMQYSIHKGVHYVNAGGGGGYALHSPREKGFHRDAGSVWEHFGDGVFVHEINGEEMVVRAVAAGGQQLTKFTVARPAVMQRPRVADTPAPAATPASSTPTPRTPAPPAPAPQPPEPQAGWGTSVAAGAFLAAAAVALRFRRHFLRPGRRARAI
eukprot:TRINITY_DN46826_c0_g1_i1.p1 TRINITY_DN46826_c0_g1~~TRINITY_DN46826_c0_g1_i1.p1  ORF type:complete len:385 (+),score=109.95 TRINITY_DN46826_c0_g1_i1:64-1218(+)